MSYIQVGKGRRDPRRDPWRSLKKLKKKKKKSSSSDSSSSSSSSSPSSDDLDDEEAEKSEDEDPGSNWSIIKVELEPQFTFLEDRFTS